MAIKKRQCPACGEMKEYRSDVKTCGCGGTNPFRMALRMPRTTSATKAEFLAEVKAASEREVAKIVETAKRNAHKPIQVRKPKKHTNLMCEINLADHHFGKLSWGQETGHANYDVKIATELFWRAFNALLEQSLVFGFYDEIWFVVGNDLFNADDISGRTTAGTYVETDVRHEKTYSGVSHLILEAIEVLRAHAKKIKVVVVPGNHDYHATFHLGCALECYFHKYTDVEVDNRPMVRKYQQFGQTAHMYTHGDKGRRPDFPALFAREVPKMWAACAFHEIKTGHNHVEKTDERHGVIIRTMPSLCPPDAWHSENGYVGNLRSSQALIYHPNRGLIATMIYTDSDENIQ